MQNIEIYLQQVDSANKDTLFRLLQFLMFETSAYSLNDTSNEAIFEYKWFDNYFTDDDRCAYIVKQSKTDNILGFAMINSYTQQCEEGRSIAEFMIMPKYRRQGIGKRVALKLFDMYKGNWEIKPCENSEKAYLFWKNIITEYVDNHTFIDGIFLFNNKDGGMKDLAKDNDKLTQDAKTDKKITPYQKYKNTRNQNGKKYFDFYDDVKVYTHNIWDW